MNTNACPHIGRCGGCPWGMIPYQEQLTRKTDEVKSLYPQVSLHPVGDGWAVRDRADLLWARDTETSQLVLGLYDLEGKSVVALETCAQMSSGLLEFFHEFRLRAPPIARKGSVRLRVSPTGERGVWLDFSNQDVKTLFEEREYLKWLSQLAYVEIGQRRKRLEWVDGQPKLKDPMLKPWFQTFAAKDGQPPIPLYGPVGGFSQAGFAANRMLVGAVADAAKLADVSQWIELFSGNGNFALALASRGFAVTALELEPLAIEGMRLSAENHPDWKITAAPADVYMKSQQLPSMSGRGLLVDPPRAGLRQVLEQLEQLPPAERPRALIYVSCFVDVFKSETNRLLALGYQLRHLVGVDQFPQTSHSEWVALFTF